MRSHHIASALALAGLLAHSTLAVAQVDPAPVDTRTTVERDDGGNWGWIGLLGLIGLVGLRRRDHVDVTATRRPA